MFSREGRIRLFLAFLVLVLVIVNSQSLQLSSESRALLTESFEGDFEARARLVAGRLPDALAPGGDLAAMEGALKRQAEGRGLRSACVLDWNARLVAGSGCDPSVGEGFARLDRDGRRRLLENGWVTTRISSPYDPGSAEATGYLVLAEDEGRQEPSRWILRVVREASAIAEANRRFRATLVYQISALSLVLIALVLFLKSLLTPHRRLVAEARSVATELVPGGLANRDEGQFLLDTFQEIVARLKEKEAELRALHLLEKNRADETEALATDIIRSMTTGLVSLDPSGAVALVNPAAERIFEIEAAGLRGRSFEEVFTGSPDLASMVRDALQKGNYHLRGRTRYRLEQGRTVHLGVSVIPLLSSGSAPKGALCLLADLTEVVELRERLFLKENLARLGELAAGIAHEFRNGLATILGNAKLLIDRKGVDSREVAEALYSESQSLARVVSEFLQFSRPEPIQAESVDLAELVRGVVAELKPRAEEASIEIEVRGEDVGLEGDEALLRKAFTNLLANAVEALAESKTAAGRISVEVARSKDSVSVRVKDNGPGIAPEHREKIFAPFFSMRAGGTGLGLSVVQKVVVSHNGSVELERCEGAGASFVVRIPVVRSLSGDSPDWV